MFANPRLWLRVAFYLSLFVGLIVALKTVKKWHYNTFVHPKVENAVKPLKTALNRMEVDSAMLAQQIVSLQRMTKELADSVKYEHDLRISQVEGLQKVVRDVHKENKYLKVNPVRVDLVELRYNCFGRLKDSSYTHTWKWVKE